ncbi:DNA-binding protein SMUBP-2 [Mactra antiquata]
MKMAAQNNISVEKFVAQTLALLEKEREEEIDSTRLLSEKLPSKELQRIGVCLLMLHIGNRRTGMFGRTVITFETHHSVLPSHKITTGDIVGLNHTHDGKSSDSLGSGIVTKVSQSAVSVAFDDSNGLFSLDDGSHDYYKLTKLANDVTYQRLKRTLGNLRKSTGDLISTLFGEQPLSPPVSIDFKPINENLDDSQQEAVKFALAQKEVAVIHGPPGTGKTTTLIEIILQTVKAGNKVLACAPSNIAVDNLVERLVDSKYRIVRLGHPARSLQHIQKYSLDAILATSDDTRLVEDVRKDLDQTLSRLKSARNHGEKQKLQEDMKYLRKELRQREERATKEILKHADIILVTLTSATDGPVKLLDKNHFDITIIDEVSQAIEAACWIPLLRSKKCIIAGDHLQLPPTILSKEAAKEGLEVTLMERILGLYGNSAVKMLTTQYRMHEKIMNWSSQKLYDSKLIAHHTVRKHLLCELPDVNNEEISLTPLVYIDTSGCDLRELDLPEEISKGNEGEADLVYIHIEKLISSGVKQQDVAVIAPYNLQVELIRLRLANKYPVIEVKSVDGFQGREKEAVIISLVRSNTHGEIGFLSEKRRMNVAVTRARRHLAVIGDSDTICKDEFLNTMIEYFNEHGEVYSAYNYMNDNSVKIPEISRPEHLNDLVSLSKKHSTNQVVIPKSVKQTGLKKQKNSQPIKEEQKHVPNHKKNVEDEHLKLKEFRKQLEDFVLNDKVDILTFPCSLNSHDRLIVHQLSEEMKLTHTSKGTGNERYIVVTKPDVDGQDKLENLRITESRLEPTLSEDKKNIENVSALSKKKKKGGARSEENVEANWIDIASSVTDDLNEELGENKEIKGKEETGSCEGKFDLPMASDGKINCTICKKKVLKSNLQLHELHCAVKSKEKQEDVKVHQKLKKQNDVKSSHQRLFDKKLMEKVEKIDKDDIDALIETVTKMDSFCCFKKCKTKVKTLFHECTYCGGRYCMSHHIPEVHGCGDAARKQASATISKDGVLSRKLPKPDEVKKAQLQRNLNSKLTEMSAKRKSKSKK